MLCALGIMLLVFVFAVTVGLSLAYFYQGKAQATFAVLGIGGPGHDGPTLTDTMIFTSVNSSGIAMLSIPRDIWYEPGKTKINALYYYGEEKKQGIELTKQAFRDMLGKEVDYYLIVDFNTFRKAVDLIGGIDINVDRAFDDNKYPIPGKENDLCNGDKTYQCRYEKLHFDAGLQHMDGELALKFARSRYSESEEGTDFARDVRQQKVIQAIRNKVMTREVLLNRKMVENLWNIFNTGVKTNITKDDILPLAKLYLSLKSKQINSFVLDGWQEENGLLYHPVTHDSKQWVLLPRGDNWDRVHLLVECLTSQANKSECFPTQK